MALIMTISILMITVLLLGLGILRLLKLYRLQSERIQALQNQLSALCTGASGLDERILRFEHALSKVRDHQHNINLLSSSQPEYDHAIRLARKGANPEQLIQNCNLSTEEAHLISRLHGSENPQQDMH